MLSPDASWVSDERLAGLTRTQQQDEFPPICPDFVIELRSKTDRLPTLKKKMGLWLHYGARLGWLLDPATETTYVRRPERPHRRQRLRRRPERRAGAARLRARPLGAAARDGAEGIRFAAG